MDNNKITAVLIAGGLGSRIKEAFPLIPKCLIEIGGETLLERNIMSLVKSGLNDIVILTKNYTKEITSYTRSKFPKLNITILQDKNYSGTGGGLIENRDTFNKTVVVVMADLYHNFNIKDFVDNHVDNMIDVSIVSHPSSHMADSDLLEVDSNGNVTKIIHKNTHSNLITKNIAMAGIFAIESEVLKKILFESNNDVVNVDLTQDIIVEAIKQDYKIKVFQTPQYIKDAGTLNRIREIEHDIVRSFALAKEGSRRPIVFLDRDGTINEEVGHVDDHMKIKIKEGVAEGINQLNKRGILVVVVTNQPVLARGECTFDTMNKINSYIELQLNLTHGAYFDDIYVCPHYPQSGFDGEVKSLKIICECRKPGTLFFKEAIERFSPDLSRMYMIGDSLTDIEAGKKINAKTIFIDSAGRNILSGANYVAKEFKEAVKIVLNELR